MKIRAMLIAAAIFLAPSANAADLNLLPRGMVIYHKNKPLTGGFVSFTDRSGTYGQAVFDARTSPTKRIYQPIKLDAKGRLPVNVYFHTGGSLMLLHKPNGEYLRAPDGSRIGDFLP